MAGNYTDTASDPYEGKGPGPYWHAQIEASEKASQNWREKAKKVIKRYRDERDAIESQRKKFNILWSNIQVLTPALYGRKPKPQVSRRYLDNDPASRLASLMIERVIEYEIENFPDFEEAVSCAVQDRLLPGRGVSWIRYEPNIITVEPHSSPDAEVAEEGAQITDDTEQSPQAEPAQRIVSVHAPCDYVFWQDFLHSPARTWEEVWWVGRWVYMTKDEGLERFGEVFNNVPCEQVESETTWRRGDSKAVRAEMEKKAKVAEVWNKRTGKVCWVAKGYPQALDERDDFLKLEGFFPCPKPLFATLTTGSLIPVPDYCQYQDQAAELDDTTQRIAMLTKACKAVGVFNAEYKELQRMMSEGVDNRLFPVDSWAAFAEKGGVQGAVQMLDIKTIAEILIHLYDAREQAKQIIYEVTGLSDIIRGSTAASETATAQQLKANFGNLRLRSSQADVARYVSDIFKLKAQIISRFYPEELIVQMSGVEHTQDGQDQNLLQAAMQVIKSTTLREFNIQVESDTLAQLDEQQEKQQAAEFTQAVGNFLSGATKLLQAAPFMAPVVAETLMFNIRRMRAGRTLESTFEHAMQQMQQMIAQAQANPQPNPEAIKAQAEQARIAADAQQEQMIAQREAQQTAIEQQAKDKDRAADLQKTQMELAEKYAFERWKVEQETDRAIIVAEINAAKAANDPQSAEAAAESGVSTGGTKAAKRASPLKAIADAHKEHAAKMEEHAAQMAQAHQAVANAVQQLGERVSQAHAESQAPVEIVRGPDGRAVGVRKGGRNIPIQRGADGRIAGIGGMVQ